MQEIHLTVSRKRFTLFLVPIAAFVLWLLFGREEARMIRDAKKIRTWAEMDEFTEKYQSRLISIDEDGISFRNPAFLSQSGVPGIYSRKHFFFWSFDESGLVKRHWHSANAEIFGFPIRRWKQRNN